MREVRFLSRSSVRGTPLLTMAVVVFVLTAGRAWPGAQDAAPAGPTVWDGVYSEAQAARATAVFGQSCANCHTLEAKGTRPLSGDKFWQSYSQKSVGDLLNFVRTSMPNNSPGSLSAASYTDLVALILKSNGFPAGASDLVPEAMAKVQIIPKGGAGELPANTLVGVVGCLARQGSDWVLTSATPPQRIDKAGARPDDATRPLGERTTILKFVLTKLDPFVGQRMSVSGMLMGAGGVDGINVAMVSRVAEACP
jgi:mono/diheme cytochrome c family protein